MLFSPLVVPSAVSQAPWENRSSPLPSICTITFLLSQPGHPVAGIRKDTKQSNMEICKEAKSAHHEVRGPACVWASALVLSCASLFSSVQAATFLLALYEIVRRLILGCFIILPCKDTVSCQNQQHVAPLGAAILWTEVQCVLRLVSARQNWLNCWSCISGGVHLKNQGSVFQPDLMPSLMTWESVTQHPILKQTNKRLQGNFLVCS